MRSEKQATESMLVYTCALHSSTAGVGHFVCTGIRLEELNNTSLGGGWTRTYCLLEHAAARAMPAVTSVAWRGGPPAAYHQQLGVEHSNLDVVCPRRPCAGAAPRALEHSMR